MLKQYEIDHLHFLLHFSCLPPPPQVVQLSEPTNIIPPQLQRVAYIPQPQLTDTLHQMAAGTALAIKNIKECTKWDALLTVFGWDNNLYQCCQFCTYEAIAPYYLDDCAKKAWIIVTLKGNKTIESSNLTLSIGNLVWVFDPSLKLYPIYPEVPNAFVAL